MQPVYVVVCVELILIVICIPVSILSVKGNIREEGLVKVKDPNIDGVILQSKSFGVEISFFAHRFGVSTVLFGSEVVFNIVFAICGHCLEVYDVRGLNTKVPASAVGVADGESLFLREFGFVG